MLERGGVECEQVDEVILAPRTAMLRCNCRKWRFQHDIQDRDRMFA